MKRIGLLATEGDRGVRERVLSRSLPDIAVETFTTGPADVGERLRETSSDYLGVRVDSSYSQAAIAACDLVDGLGKETSSVSLVMYQYTGPGSRMLIGFNTEVSGIVRASQEAVGESAGRALILGGREVAASALAALVQLKASTIAVAPREIAGPGSALGASHRLGIDVLAYRYDDVAGHLGEFDTVVVASDDIPEQIREELAQRSGVVIAAVPGVDLAESDARRVSYREVLIRQIEDDVRVLTGVNPEPDALTQAVDNALGA